MCTATSGLERDDHRRDHHAQMGPDHDRGQNRVMAQAGRVRLRRRRGIAGDRDFQDHQRGRGRQRRRAGACCRARRQPIGALLAVVASPDTPGAEIDAFVAGFAVPEPAQAETAETAAPEPQMLEAGGYRLRVLELGSGGTPVVPA